MEKIEKIIKYKTRDAKGADIIKDVKIKQYTLRDHKFDCPICGKYSLTGVKTKDIVSTNFTDWAYVGDYVCSSCTDLFSLYFYSYIVDIDGIRLLNVRELRDQLIRPQKPPFLFIITTSQKKHLFYKARWNYGGGLFAVNLETETIYTMTERMRVLFDFVECLLTLGCSKEAMKQGEINFKTAEKVGFVVSRYLRSELDSSREIQIPLYCGQKRDITEEEAICTLSSIPMI